MKGLTFFMAMILVQLAYGGSNILIKISIGRGLNQLVFVVYRHVIAMLLLGPFAYALEREQRPPLSVSVITKIFVLSSLGTTVHLNLYYAGLAYTSPTVACALSNVIPSLTFVLALLFGMEKVKITSKRGQAKVAGAVICVGGSLLFALWKGGFPLKSFVERPLINMDDNTTSTSTTGSLSGSAGHEKQNWIKGSVLILISYIAWSAWLILQALVSKVYPAQLSLNTMICFFASLQSSLLALFFARNPTLWKLDWNVQLLTIIYCGVVISALVYILQTWCISNKGPVFVAMFSPPLLIIVAIFSAIIFAEQLHFGSLVGAFVIIVGLYCVLWGKRTDILLADQQPAAFQKDSNSDHNQVLEISMEDGPPTNSVSSQRT
ncbi:Plant-drug/metabolite exporter [Trema orientale]|uniref:WAT1-related protein n=1 Tax=Trema orientale TaxID=63057 RepID=A0A2P5F5H2_TREOI|nr:Plant-drug/metabolite exporter [Trema orientale]